MTTNKKSVRLPLHIIPQKYNLTLKPDLEAFVFTGVEIIKLIINKNSKTITLHSKDIDIEKVEIENNKNKQFQFASKISYDTKRETATFIFKNEIKKGEVNLKIIFSGIINESLRGFYKSKYEIGGITKHIATTQFEATDARRAFPCFDEPAHKAVFEVSLIVPGTHTAISNTLPISIKEHEAGYKIVKFAPTPLMSTYLLAFIIGEFEYIEGFTKSIKKNHGGTRVRVFTTKGKSHQAKFALEVAIKSIEFYNEYFDIPYPLPTLDLIAIPDFESAAMENWGAVTFRETAILVDEKNTSLSNKQWVAIVIAHELAHQWFGNLVTMEWWTDLWLNEGFASYMENLCTDAMFPEWHVWDQYLSDRYALALHLDSLSNSHPIEVEVHHPDEIGEIFDMVSYAKGSAVIRMLAEYLGHDKFRDGLRYYLNKHSYKNTKTIDLWNAFEKVSKKPIKKIMKNWTSLTGYPLLTVDSKNKKTGITYEITQERFFSSRVQAKNNKIKNIWQIPISYESNNEEQKMLLIKNKAPLIGSYIGKINKEERTFTRVRYDKDTLIKIGNEIKNGKLNVVDRLGIIRDLFALAEGGYISTIDVLEFSLLYKDETEYIVWQEIAGGINKIYNLIQNESFKEKYKLYALSLFQPLSVRLGWNHIKGENHSDIFLRNLALSHAASYGDKIIINEAIKLFKNKDKFPIRADIRGFVYNIVASHGKIKEWNLFEKLYKKEEFHEEKDRLARALSSFKDKDLIIKTLNFALSKNVRNQDAPFIIVQVWQKSKNRDLTWKFVKNNWENILKHWGLGGHFLSRIIGPLGNHTTLKDLKDAKKFFSKNTAPGAERTLEQAYEKIASNTAWIKDDKKSIRNWLEKNY
jgi:puromycin-sensitive aminopeptidase